MISFTITSSPDIEAQGNFQYELDYFTIGKDKSAFLQLHDQDMDDIHLEIQSNPQGIIIVDKSKNGTYLNNKRMNSPKQLKEGDLIKAGKTIFQVEQVEYRETKSSKVRNPEIEKRFMDSNSLEKKIIDSIQEILNENDWCKERIFQNIWWS